MGFWCVHCPLSSQECTDDSDLALSTQFQTKCERNQMNELAERYTNISRAKSGKIVTMMTLPLVSEYARILAKNCRREADQIVSSLETYRKSSMHVLSNP